MVLTKQKIEDWIVTYVGEKFYPIEPIPEDIYLENIAHGLSLMCRFNGQCYHMFSVGQHSINVQKELADMTKFWNRKDSLKVQLIGLFHDASECLGISDICSPAKKYMPEYRAFEDKIQNAVWEHFKLQHSEEEYKIIKLVDSAMAAYEARTLMKCKYFDLNYSYLIHCAPESKSYINLELRDVVDVENEFLNIAEELLNEYEDIIYREENS